MKLFKLTILTLLLVFNSCKTDVKKSENNRKSLFLVFNRSESTTANFWKKYNNTVFQYIKNAYESGKITYVLPFSHGQLKHPDSDKTWTNALIIGLNSSEDYTSIAKKIIEHVKKSEVSSELKSADIMSLQNGLDMFYSIKNGIAEEDQLEQILEYVFSDPSARKEYYNEQYLFSGPAMREFHDNNMAGRFIGYEVEKRLLGNDFPEWDLIHVVGFTEAQSEKATPVFKSTFSKHAERAFGKGMTLEKKMKEWDKIRINIKSNASQNMDMTLPIKSKNNN